MATPARRRLTQEQVTELRNMIRAGQHTYANLATIFGVSISTVGYHAQQAGAATTRERRDQRPADVPPAPTLLPAVDIEWMQSARCTEIGGDLWFPEKKGDGSTGQNFTNQAKAICQTCPVRAECLDYALAYESGDMGTHTSYAVAGIYGGLSPRERHKILRARENGAAA